MSTLDTPPLNTVGTISSRGGARPGSGKKPGGYVRPPEAVAFDQAKARSEIAKALKLERENKIEDGEYVSRTAVAQAAAVSYASLAQSLRTISDTLERKGVAPEVCVMVDEAIHQAMADHAAEMAMMAGNPPAEGEDE